MVKLLIRSFSLVLALLCANVTNAQIANTQAPSMVSGSLFGGTTGYIYTALSAPSAGQGIICVERNGNNRALSSVTLSSSGTTTAFTFVVGLSSPRIEMWYATATGSETNANVVFTLAASANDFEAIGCIVFSGWNSDQSSSTSITQTTTAQTTHTVGTVTPTVANNVIVHFSERMNRTWTEDSNYTQVTTGSVLFEFSYWIQTSATARLHTMISDTTSDAGMLLAQFAGTGGGGGGATSKSLMLLGVGR